MGSESDDQRIGMFGGSFDPPHLGHEHIAIEAIRRLELKRLCIVPARQSPFKTEHSGASKHRLSMSDIMVGSIRRRLEDEHVSCDVVLRKDEVERRGRSFSWLTVKTLRQEFPNARLFLIIGEDNLPGFPRWQKWRKILSCADLIVAPREAQEDTPRPVLPRVQNRLPHELEDYADSVHFIDSPVLPAASSNLRDLLSAGKSVEGMLNPEVYEYIRSNSVYQV